MAKLKRIRSVDRTRHLFLLAGPLLAGLLIFSFGLSPQVLVAGLMLWMALWWSSSAAPLWVTALLPALFLPLFGILPAAKVASYYFNDTVFLLISGFFLAQALERWGLHQRIALRILLITGATPARALLGLMAAGFCMSAWVSNTSVAVMLLPLALALAAKLQPGPAKPGGYGEGLLLGLVYAISLGGMVTLVGTPPNLTLVRTYATFFPEARPLGFTQWMAYALPLAGLLCLGLWAAMAKAYAPRARGQGLTQVVLRRDLRDLGPWTLAQRWTLACFCLAVLLWLTRADLVMGAWSLAGWSRWMPEPSFVTDGSVGLLVSLALFFLPSGQGTPVLDEQAVQRLPWDLVLLFGGGLALAQGLQASGLAAWLVDQSRGMIGWPLLVVLPLVLLFITLLSELASNTAMAEMILPVLAEVSRATAWPPLMLLAPATLACSLGFMLPVATPPNALALGTGYVSVRAMLKWGLALNLVGIGLISAATLVWGSLMLVQ